MKRTFKYYLICAFALHLFTACSEYLDVAPDNRVELTDLDKVEQLLVSAYSVASPAFTEIMTDNVGFTVGVTIRQSHEQAYAWEDVTTGPTEQDTPDFYWYETYNAIAHANEALAALEKIETQEEEAETRKNALISEAKLCRAYGHFMLVNLFGPHYLQGVRKDGVPYIEKPETDFLQQYERESVRDVYRKIEKDLLDGLRHIGDRQFSNSGKYRFNLSAARAFASRYYLFRGMAIIFSSSFPVSGGSASFEVTQSDIVKSLQYSDELLGGNPGVYIKDLNSDQFQLAKASITGYPQLWTSPDLTGNLLLMRKISLVQRPDFGHGPLEVDYGQLFAPIFSGLTDERENPAFVKGQNGLLPVRYQSLFQRNSLNSNVGTPYHIAVIFTGEEVLFNRMEANLYLNNLDGVVADLQILYDRRYSGSDREVTIERIRNLFGNSDNDSSDDFFNLLNMILIERQKEFILQGLRWFDIKRFALEVTHSFQNQPSAILTENDSKKILQIPQSAQDVGGLKPNPR